VFSCYVNLALRSLRRNPALTLLMILAIGVGIGASMTTLTAFRAMGADPIAATGGIAGAVRAVWTRPPQPGHRGHSPPTAAAERWSGMTQGIDVRCGCD
jgi:putative ABC transport system permease protein